MDPHLDATAQAELVRSGEVTSQELVEGAIERIEALNGELNAVIHPLFDAARATEPAAGPFQGVPFLIKDLMCHTAGDPMHEGMAFLRDAGWSEAEDTWLARRFREAGFVSLGKTNTPELGILPTTEPAAYGATRNPWDTTRSPGGSSGGSAAAVAAGLVPIAHANDGGGSIRIPASCCGLVGLKPSRGRVSLAPEFGDFMSGLVDRAGRVALGARHRGACSSACPTRRRASPTSRRPASATTARRSAPTRAPACRADDAPAGWRDRGAP